MYRCTYIYIYIYIHIYHRDLAAADLGGAITTGSPRPNTYTNTNSKLPYTYTNT